MSKSNGHDQEAAEYLIAASDTAGGYWTGATYLRSQIDQLEAVKQHQAANHQIAIDHAIAESDRACRDWEAAMKVSDYKAAAAAARRVSYWEARLAVFGVYRE